MYSVMPAIYVIYMDCDDDDVMMMIFYQSNQHYYLLYFFSIILEVKCRWLDFFDDLIEPRSRAMQTSSSSSSSSDKLSSHMQLRPQYALDGTHLNPSYLLLLENALNK